MTATKISGKTVLITGASGGLGRKMVEALLAAGARQIIAADRIAKNWNHRVKEITLDITDETHVKEAAAYYADIVDILINNAGSNANSRFLDVDPAFALREMQVNYFGTLSMIRCFAPAMRKRGHGTIVNVITIGSQISFPNMGSYCASKAALHSLTQSVRAELGYYGVRVVGIYPPAVDTPMSAHVSPDNKMTADEVASGILEAILTGQEDLYLGMAADLRERLRRDPKEVENMLKSRVAPA